MFDNNEIQLYLKSSEWFENHATEKVKKTVAKAAGNGLEMAVMTEIVQYRFRNDDHMNADTEDELRKLYDKCRKLRAIEHKSLGMYKYSR